MRILFLVGFLLLCWVGQGLAIQGVCSNCHTMHNSQGGVVMVYNGTSPQPYLLRGSCTGCHAQGKSSNIVNGVPQVYHSASQDLAGGNFAYITGLKTGGDGGSGDAYGHNVMDIPGINLDSVLGSGEPPGYSIHPVTPVFASKGVSCAGERGCHGVRWVNLSPMEGIKGAHHSNITGLVNGTGIGGSYRFLIGVKGYEVSDWQNTSPTHHNEYYALTSPTYELSCSNTSCHQGPNINGYSGYPVPPDGTISQFCGTCHPLFHSATATSSNATSPSSPWLRHPTDYALPTTGEYAQYNNGTLTYSVLAPVARTSWPISGISSTVTPGSDAVMCLSCHYAHAGPYPDMLRWDYRTCVAGGGSNSTACGCFVCHTSKD
ncbi:hypothetical protein [Thermosulfurimonas sp. F29]|uniref:hypothetical protein n=1 Tax=Thermosulfurimonas sp. F29 TaxID=2867247 RepID=UPI001C838C3B|nr:hypothetical protein [Thermosulfurimonas sp. F29]MBX6422050.1 hypothetical protein [Thermosulfurimonas sp. F29]